MFIKPRFLSTLILFLILSTSICAFAETSAGISVTGSRGILDISVSAVFTSQDGGAIAVYANDRCILNSGGAIHASDWNYSFRYDSAAFPDGTQVYRIEAASMADSSYGYASQTVDVNNTIYLDVLSPTGSVRGTADLSIGYNFPSCFLTYNAPRFYIMIDGIHRYTEWLALSSEGDTIGVCHESLDTNFLTDGPHTIEATEESKFFILIRITDTFYHC